MDQAIQQEQRLVALVRNFKPVVETYIQDQKPDTDLGSVPKDDEYFLSRLDLTGDAPANYAFQDEETLKQRAEKKIPKGSQAYEAVGFAQSVFPDLGHFDRQNYAFEFVRWEVLGEVRCAAIDVTPRVKSGNRAFAGRIWVDERDFAIVRFTGTYMAKALSQRSFHFDSWRVNVLPRVWIPAYVYTQESDPRDPSNRAPLFKAQTRIWGYDLQHAGDHKEFAKRLTDAVAFADPKRQESSQGLDPSLSLVATPYSTEDSVVERLQVAGLMAPDGDVDRVLETVANNLLITNDLNIAGVRCRVLLTAPLESFVVGRTIVVSRGLLDVLPDEASLAAVLAHEIGHIVLHHSMGDAYQSAVSLSFADLRTFERLNFRFDDSQEAAADRKGFELLSKSPYKDQLANAALFLQTLQARAPLLPKLLRGRFSNGFASSHLIGMTALATAGPQLQLNRIDQVAALPMGSRIKIDPWSDRIEMLKRKPVHLLTAAEKMPFEVSPFFPYLKRQGQEKAQPPK